MASVAALLRREIAIHFEKERVSDPIFVIMCLKRQVRTVQQKLPFFAMPC
jgi:hypothetical protein